MFPVKTVRFCLLCLSLLAGTAQAIQVNFLIDAPLDSTKGQLAKLMAGIIEQQLPDYQITLLDKLQNAGSPNQSINALQSNQVQFLLPDTADLQTLNPEMKIFSIPFLFRGEDTLKQFTNSPKGKGLLNSLSSKNITGLGILYGGMKQLVSNERINGYSDISRLTFPYSMEDPNLRPALQVNMVPVADGDLLKALNSGKINAREATYEEINNNQLHLQYRYLLESNHALNTSLLVVNNKFWSSLAPSQQKVFITAADKALRFGNQLTYAAEVNSKEQIRLEGGARKSRLSEKERIVWVSKIQPLWASEAELIGQDLFNTAFDYANKLHFYTENFPPYNFADDSGELKGIAVDFLKAVYSQTKYYDMGLDAELKTWSYGYQAAQTGPNVVLFSTTRTASRENLFKWAGPITASQTVVFKRKQDDIQINQTSDLNNYRVAVIRDDVGQVLARDQGVKPENMKVYSTVENLLEDLNSGTVDVWIYNLAVGRWFIKQQGYNNEDYDNVYKLNEGFLYFAFSPDVDDRIVANIQQAIDKVKNTRGTDGLSVFDKIVSRYQ